MCVCRKLFCRNAKMKTNGNINSILQLVTDFNERVGHERTIEMPLETKINVGAHTQGMLLLPMMMMMMTTIIHK